MRSLLFRVWSLRSSISRALLVVLALLFVVTPAHAGKKSGKPWLGISMVAGDGGVVVDHVFKTSPAEKANLKKGDLLIRADGVVLEKPDDLVQHVARHKPGMTIKLLMRRGGKDKTVSAVLADHPGSAEIARLMHVGNQAYEPKDLTAVQGAIPTEMKELEGKVVLIEFFASWCTNCKAVTPQLAALHKKYGDKGLAVIGITSDEKKPAEDVIKKWKIPYAVASDATHATFDAYSVSAIPALFVIDRKGIIREVLIGYDPEQRAATEKLIKKLLDEKS